MSPTAPVTALTWIGLARDLLDTLAETQADAIEQASQWCADAIGGGAGRLAGCQTTPPTHSIRSILTRSPRLAGCSTRREPAWSS